MAKLNLGYCGICETEIWNIQGNRPVPNDQYATFWMHIDDDTIAAHAICLGCYGSLSSHKVVNLFERIKEDWADEMVGWATDKDFYHMRSKTILSWGLSEHQVYDHIIDYEGLI